MKRFIGFAVIGFLSLGLGWSADPFTSKEDAVGYIVIKRDGREKRFIVLQSKDGKVRLIKTGRSPENILKKGGKKK